MVDLKPAPAPAYADLTKEANDRLADCRLQKQQFDQDIREGYFFAAPHRARQASSMTATPATKPTDADTLQISIGFEESENFVTTVMNAFMPEGMEWVAQRAAVEVEDVMKPEIEQAVGAITTATFGLLGESNFYAETAKTMNPDLAIGLIGMWITSPKLHQPVVCQGVPIRELEVNIDWNGDVGDRFVVRHTKNRHALAMLAKVEIPEAMRRDMEKKPAGPAEIRWGYWRLWDRPDEVWRHVIMLKDKVIHSEELTGEGCCPLVVSRFGAFPEWAYGVGPLIRALPELRHLDDQAAGETENIDQTLRPPMTYPDDSFAGIENGVEAGGWYPIRPGTEGAVKKMIDPNPLDAALFDAAARERRVKRLFYNDMPEQRGDTPPTATQWVDEMAMAQRRIGTPGQAFFREGPLQFFLRFRYLLKERGKLRLPKVGDRDVALAPYNPTQRAQDSQKVANAMRAGQIGAALFPEEFKVKVDGAASIENIIGMLGAGDVLAMRSEAQVQQAADLIAPLMGGAAPAAPVPGAPA